VSTVESTTEGKEEDSFSFSGPIFLAGAHKSKGEVGKKSGFRLEDGRNLEEKSRPQEKRERKGVCYSNNVIYQLVQWTLYTGLPLVGEEEERRNGERKVFFSYKEKKKKGQLSSERRKGEMNI